MFSPRTHHASTGQMMSENTVYQNSEKKNFIPARHPDLNQN